MIAILHRAGLGLLLLLLLAACTKKEGSFDNLRQDADVVAREDDMIREYLRRHNINATRDVTGLYYKILSHGDSLSYMSPASIPTIRYERRLLNDSLVDASFGITDFGGKPLKDHILGWQVGLLKIAKGGRIYLVIPSQLAFGKQQVANIPPNSPLVCDIELVDFR